MRQLFIIIAIITVMNAGAVNAMEHSALSNVFTLDIRTTVERIPLEHSAMSDIFTLDTRTTTERVPLEHSAMSNIFTLDTRDPEAPSWDLNSDGITDIYDLVIIAGVFGQSGEDLAEDLNSDGVVDIMDLVIVASHFGETTNLGAPASPRMANADHVDMVEGWLKTAKMANDGSELFQRGACKVCR